MAQWYEVFDRVLARSLALRPLWQTHYRPPGQAVSADPQTLAPNPNIAILAQIDKLNVGRCEQSVSFTLAEAKSRCKTLRPRSLRCGGLLNDRRG